MYAVVAREVLAPQIVRFTVSAPRVASVAAAGQFVIVRAGEHSERIPLTIAAADPASGTVTLVVQTIGASTHEICAIPAGGEFTSFAGPLGRPSELLNSGRALCVGGGVGTAVIWPIAAALSARGVTVTSIIGARNAGALICERELRAFGEVIVCTDDGSAGHHGLVSEPLARLCEQGGVDGIWAAGPVPMMAAVAAVSAPYHIPTTVSLNAIMLDGTGMCGGCRVGIGGKAVYACVDGPEFDAHQVDFAALSSRLRTYRPFEQAALARWVAEHPEMPS